MPLDEIPQIVNLLLGVTHSNISFVLLSILASHTRIENKRMSQQTIILKAY